MGGSSNGIFPVSLSCIGKQNQSLSHMFRRLLVISLESADEVQLLLKPEDASLLFWTWEWAAPNFSILPGATTDESHLFIEMHFEFCCGFLTLPAPSLCQASLYEFCIGTYLGFFGFLLIPDSVSIAMWLYLWFSKPLTPACDINCPHRLVLTWCKLDASRTEVIQYRSRRKLLQPWWANHRNERKVSLEAMVIIWCGKL